MTPAEDLRGILARFAGLPVLVAGDVILDRYWWGHASRLSPEAPVPVVRKSAATVIPGGAANTAANLEALGSQVRLFGVTGADVAAAELRAALEERGIHSVHLEQDSGRPTTTKTRIVAAHQQIVRVDEECTDPVPVRLAVASAQALVAALPGAAAVVISDYAKGYVTPDFLQTVIGAAGRQNTPVFIDPKGSDRERYRGATLLKPNRLELGLLTGTEVRTHEETLTAGCRLASALPESLILVTEGAEGMTLFAGAEVRGHVASAPRQVFDVTGAGDTVLATVALAIAAGADYLAAMELATEAAGIAIGLMGTSSVTRKQLEAAFQARGIGRHSSHTTAHPFPA